MLMMDLLNVFGFNDSDGIAMTNGDGRIDSDEMSILISSSIEKRLNKYSRIDGAWALGISAISISVFLLFLSIGITVALYGYSFVYDDTASAQRIARIFSNAISNIKIAAVVDGSVSIENPALLVDPSSTVSVKEGALVGISSDSTVHVDANIKMVDPRPTDVQLKLGSRVAEGDIPNTSYAIFYDIPLKEGFVETSHFYTVDNQNHPLVQFCNYVRSLDKNNSARYLIGKDGTLNPSANQTTLPYKKEELFGYCHWKL